MKFSTKYFSLLLTLFLFLPAEAHEHEKHHDDMKSSATLPGVSIYHLSSQWINQNSKSIKLTDLQGKPQLIVMLFTRCETSCPLIVEDLKGIASQLEQVQVSIFSLDSTRETSESLKAFSVRRKLPESWNLLTSPTDGAVAELAAALGLRYKRLQNGDFIHSNVIYFLNSKGEVLAKKEGLKTPNKEFLKQIRQTL